MKYKIEHLLAFRVLKTNLWDSIKNATINTDKLSLEFNVELKDKKGNYKRKLNSLLNEPLEDQYKTLLAAEMLAEGYMCLPTKGGWVVLSPKGEEYQLTTNECTCNDYLYGCNDEPCKHLIFKDWHLQYRSKIQLEKTKRGLV